MLNNTYTKQTLAIEEEYPTFLKEEHQSSLEEIELITAEIAELYQKHLEWGYHYA